MSAYPAHCLLRLSGPARHPVNTQLTSAKSVSPCGNLATQLDTERLRSLSHLQCMLEAELEIVLRMHGVIFMTCAISAEDLMQVVVGPADNKPGRKEGLISLAYVPMGTTCAMYEGRLITDPDAEEEALAASLITSVVDGTGRIIGTGPPSQSTAVHMCGQRSTPHRLSC